jgi:YVTN family beta-propeller protein
LQPGDPERAGSYRLLGRLGNGGMGQVFLGRSAGGRPVAVKVIRADLAGDREFRARFRREVAAARQVNSLYTAPVVDADLDGVVPWLATTYVAGPSLADAVADHGPLPAGAVLALAAGLAEGLAAIHASGVVHRDLKPANVLLADDGPRLIDFGISLAVEASTLTHTGMVVGSPGFMSPEQAEGGEVGPPSDVFSLGAVLTFAATGEGPFGTGSLAALVYRVVHASPSLDRVPDAMRSLVERCLAKEPGERPSASELLAELGDTTLMADWLPEQIIRELPRYAMADPASVEAEAAVEAGAGADSPAWAATQGTASGGVPDDTHGGPPTAAARTTSPPPEPGWPSGQPVPGHPRRSAHRRLVLASVTGAVLAACAAVGIALAVAPGRPTAGEAPPTLSSPASQAARVTASASVQPSASASSSATATRPVSAPTTIAPPPGTPGSATSAAAVSTRPSVTATIPVGSTPLWVAVTPDGRHAYVANATTSTVSVISTASNTVIATISVPTPSRVAVSPDGSEAYVTECPDNCPAGSQGDVAVIDTASNRVTASITVGSGPFGVAFTPDGRHAYVTDRNATAVSVIDTASHTVTATITVGVFPTSVAVSPDGREAYVTNATTNTVSVISTASNTVLTTIPTGSSAFSVAFTPDSRYAYVDNLDNGTVAVVSTASNAVITNIGVGAQAFGVAVSPDGRYAYVSDGNSNVVSVIDVSRNVVTATIPVATPNGVAFTPDGRHAYVTNRNSGTASVISTGTA